MLFDSHAHLTDDPLFDEIEPILKRAKESGISQIVNVCTTPLSLYRGLSTVKKHPNIFLAGATTPHDVEKEGQEAFNIFATSARNRELVAIGETGLDYHYGFSQKDIQQDFLRRYLHLALECHLPMIIHCREAFDDFFSILDSEYRINNGWGKGVLHCFTGTLKEAEEVIKRGWMISLSGIVTFKKSMQLQEVAKEIPLEHLLIETDAPYLAPQTKRGRQNEPAFLVETATFIAQLKNLSFENLAATTTNNTKNFFFSEKIH